MNNPMFQANTKFDYPTLNLKKIASVTDEHSSDRVYRITIIMTNGQHISVTFGEGGLGYEDNQYEVLCTSEVIGTDECGIIGRINLTEVINIINLVGELYNEN